MADNSKKVPLALSVDAAGKQRAGDAISLLGMDLPCHVVKREGQIVTIAFDVNGPWNLPNQQVPIHTGAHDWLPIKVGTKGVVKSCDVYLGGVSGLGSGTADFSRRATFATQVFIPATNKEWQPPGGGHTDDRIIQGEKGTLLLGKASNGDVKTKLYVDDDGHVVVTGDLLVTGEIRGKYLTTNIHVTTHTHAQDPDSDGDVEEETHAPTPGS